MPQPDKPLPYPNKPPSSELETDVLTQKTDSELVSELKGQWKLMWKEHFNDKAKAEGISVDSYASLNVEKGTVIKASRDFKVMHLKEILEQHKIENPERFIPPDSNIGGWNKFIKTKITNNKSLKEKQDTIYTVAKSKGQHPKKGGRGWIHNI
jgi:hypothetical protein